MDLQKFIEILKKAGTKKSDIPIKLIKINNRIEILKIKVLYQLTNQTPH